jgi:hypothetical protein
VTPSTLLVTDDGLPRGVSGADPRFANAIKVFVQLFSARRFGGGALSVYVDGVVTGRGLAKMYAVLANDGRIDGKKFLSKELARGLTGQAMRKWPDATWWCPCLFTSATTRRYPGCCAVSDMSGRPPAIRAAGGAPAGRPVHQTARRRVSVSRHGGVGGRLALRR